MIYSLLTKVLGYTGIPAISRRWIARRGRFVLMFHGVSKRKKPELPANLQPYLSQNDLRAILSWVSSRFPILSFEDFLSTNKPGVLLTFDDGLANNKTNVIPVLEEFAAPAIFFIPLQHVVNPRNWLSFNRAYAKQGWDSEQSVPEDIAIDFYDGMAETQLKHCANHPLITIGAHSWSHPFLTACTDQELDYEIGNARECLEAMVGKPVQSFAYPTGDYDQRVLQKVQQFGYRAAFVIDSKHLGSPSYEVPRIGIYDADPAYLSLKLSGLHRRPLVATPISPLTPAIEIQN